MSQTECLEREANHFNIMGEDGMLKDDLIEGAEAAAAFCGLRPRQIYNWAESGRLPVVRIGRKLFFRRSELERAFSSREAA